MRYAFSWLANGNCNNSTETSPAYQTDVTVKSSLAAQKLESSSLFADMPSNSIFIRPRFI